MTIKYAIKVTDQATELADVQALVKELAARLPNAKIKLEVAFICDTTKGGK
jgi:hypothetical protein